MCKEHLATQLLKWEFVESEFLRQRKSFIDLQTSIVRIYNFEVTQNKGNSKCSQLNLFCNCSF